MSTYSWCLSTSYLLTGKHDQTSGGYRSVQWCLPDSALSSKTQHIQTRTPHLSHQVCLSLSHFPYFGQRPWGLQSCPSQNLGVVPSSSTFFSPKDFKSPSLWVLSILPAEYSFTRSPPSHLTVTAELLSCPGFYKNLETGCHVLSLLPLCLSSTSIWAKPPSTSQIDLISLKVSLWGRFLVWLEKWQTRQKKRKEADRFSFFCCLKIVHILTKDKS